MPADSDQQAIRRPHPEVLQILDPRPLLDEAAAIGARYSSPGLLVGETLAAGLTYGRQLWFGTERNIGTRLAQIVDDLTSLFTLATRLRPSANVGLPPVLRRLRPAGEALSRIVSIGHFYYGR